MSEKRAPIQGDSTWFLDPRHPDRVPNAKPAGTISWEEHEEIWREYHRQYPNDQSAKRMAERGGFGHCEFRLLLGREARTFEPNAQPVRRDGAT